MTLRPQNYLAPADLSDLSWVLSSSVSGPWKRVCAQQIYAGWMNEPIDPQSGPSPSAAWASAVTSLPCRPGPSSHLHKPKALKLQGLLTAHGMKPKPLRTAKKAFHSLILVHLCRMSSRSPPPRESVLLWVIMLLSHTHGCYGQSSTGTSHLSSNWLGLSMATCLCMLPLLLTPEREQSTLDRSLGSTTKC